MGKMKCCVDRKAFLAVMKAAAAVAQKEPEQGQRGVLTTVRLKSLPGTDELEISTTDGEATLLGRTPVQSTKGLDCALPAETLYKTALRMASGETLTLSGVTWRSLKLSDGSARANILGVDPEDFPRVPNPEPSFFDLHETFADAAGRVVFAIGDHKEKPQINGLHVRTSPSRLQLVATDGVKVGITHLPCVDGPADGSFTIPRSASRIISELPDGQMSIGLDGSAIVVATADAASGIYTRLITGPVPGAYPDVVSMIPELGNCVEVGRELLEAALERAKRFCGERMLRLESDEGTMRLSATKPDFGEFEQTLPARWQMRSDELVDAETHFEPVILNVRFLAEILRRVEGESVLMRINGTLAPARIQGAKNDDSWWALMPMRPKGAA